ncbi:MAG: FIST N-terminal domain-containing protein [Candidatus Korarchaeota archaeon]
MADAIVAYSTDKSVDNAISKIAETIVKSVPNPDWIFMTTTVAYPAEELAKKMNESFKGARIHGVTSCLGVITNDGYIIGPENYSIAALAVKSKKIKFGVGYGEGDDAGKKALDMALKSAGMPSNAKPTLILMTAVPGMEERVIENIEEAVGKDVPIYGGTAADNDISGKWKVICNDKVLSGVVITVIFTKLKIGTIYLSGYSAVGIKGTVTKSSGRVIQEIDGKPAASIYNTWTNKKFAKFISAGESILGPASFAPLARKIVSGDKEYWISVHPSKCVSGAIEVFAEVPQGSDIWLLSGDENVLLNRPSLLFDLCLKNMKSTPDKVDFGILIYCAGTMLPVKDKLGKSIKETLQKISGPIIGAFTFGEQGHIPKIGNFHGNLMASLILFKKKGFLF